MSSDLTTKTPIILPVPPLDLGDMPFAEEGDPDETLEKAINDREVGTSVQYIDFSLVIPDEARGTMAAYKKAVLAYRSWASLRWWNTTYASSSVPQDESIALAAKRVSYSARVADYDIKHTPWLFSSKGEIKNKKISASSKDFHAAFANIILEGFVSLPGSGFGDLEKVFEVLTKARYEYSPRARIVRSFIRTCLFKVTSEMVEVQRKKGSSTTMNVPTAYNEYEAGFNVDDWTQVSDMIEKERKSQMEDFVKNDTVEILA
ncbi:hypothetical protein BHYA_0141g00030 [Botrytis hyacinthi]|uniref:Uncharacterized protein n=1 Tax=Botrytis hyacinthi TaxID=278943 RepID=A0A4Z1GIC2_9HELO|nr:hypothetical protein BHYA_0141g00030 [Botrytis hyacinthi]